MITIINKTNKQYIKKHSRIIYDILLNNLYHFAVDSLTINKTSCVMQNEDFVMTPTTDIKVYELPSNELNNGENLSMTAELG